MEWYLKALKNYVGFNGRARRKEYWMFYLFNIIIVFVLYGLGMATIKSIGGLFIALYGLYALGVFLPSLAVSIRRLHDINKSGWWYLISLVPLIGSIWLIVLLATEGTRGENAYGPDPKEAIV